VIYSLAYKMFGDKYWGMGELLYGLAQGAVLSVGFLLQ
jgi:hypothetical protein